MAIFQRVAERGSFAGAAADVGLSASAVAKLITRLEQRLGVRLINRTTRRLALTAEGEIYLDRARDWGHRGRRIRDCIRACIAAGTLAGAHVSRHCRPATRAGIAGLSGALPSDYVRFHGDQSYC